MFSGTMRGFEAGIGIGCALGRIGQLGAGRRWRRRAAARAFALPVQFAASRTRSRTSSSGSTAAIFARGSTLVEIAGDERDFGVGLGAGDRRRRLPRASDSRQHLLRD